jgi:hypothetical protein
VKGPPAAQIASGSPQAQSAVGGAPGSAGEQHPTAHSPNMGNYPEDLRETDEQATQQCKKENDKKDCSGTLTPQAARGYASIAQSAYYQPMQQSVKSPLIATIAVTKVKTAFGQCVEVAAMNNRVSSGRDPVEVANLDLSRSIFVNRALSRGARFYAPPIDPVYIEAIDAPAGALIPVPGHAESNLYLAVQGLGAEALTSFVAMGISQHPCRDLRGTPGQPNRPGCGTWLRSTNLTVWYYDRVRGPVPFL